VRAEQSVYICGCVVYIRFNGDMVGKASLCSKRRSCVRAEQSVYICGCVVYIRFNGDMVGKASLCSKRRSCVRAEQSRDRHKTN